MLLQKRAVRIIAKKPFLPHSKPLFIKYKILRFPEMVKEQCIMILLAHINDNLPNTISSLLKYTLTSNTRSTQHFVVPYASSNYILFTLSCSAPKIWNATVGTLYKILHEVPKNKKTLKSVIRFLCRCLSF